MVASKRGPRAASVSVPVWDGGMISFKLADAIRPVQSGDVNLYLLYVFAVILLAYLLGAV